MVQIFLTKFFSQQFKDRFRVLRLRHQLQIIPQTLQTQYTRYKTPWTTVLSGFPPLFHTNLSDLSRTGRQGANVAAHPLFPFPETRSPSPGAFVLRINHGSANLSLSLSLFPFARRSRLELSFNSVAESRIVRYRNARAYTRLCRLIIPVNEGPRFAARLGSIDRTADLLFVERRRPPRDRCKTRIN